MVLVEMAFILLPAAPVLLEAQGLRELWLGCAHLTSQPPTASLPYPGMAGPVLNLCFA